MSDDYLSSQEDRQLQAYFCDGVYVDAEMPKRELDRRMKKAERVVALYTDGTRETRKDPRVINGTT